MQKTIVLAAAALALASPWAAAQTVWRCGSSYSHEPCPGGAAVSASTSRPTPADAAAAAEVARTDARLAADMEKARLAREREAPRAIVIGPQPSTPPAAAKHVKDGARPRAGEPEPFTAVSPGPAGEKKKAKGKKKG